MHSVCRARARVKEHYGVGNSAGQICNLPADKREHITTAATTEFARHDYEQANTNRIAKEADISVGVLFKYFPTKADLFLYVVRKGAEIIEAKPAPGFGIGCGVLEIVGKLVDVIGNTSASEREAVQMYQAMTALGDRAFAKETAAELERYTLKQYLAVLERGQECGEVRTDIPAELLTLFVDNQFISLQYTLATAYYEERRHMYVGEMPSEQVLSATKQLLRVPLAPTS